MNMHQKKEHVPEMTTRFITSEQIELLARSIARELNGAEGRAGGKDTICGNRPISDVGRDACNVAECMHRVRFRRIIGQVISTLEATRSSFKSKRLEVLRKELLGILEEEL
jgi:hypothetical protein